MGHKVSRKRQVCMGTRILRHSLQLRNLYRSHRYHNLYRNLVSQVCTHSNSQVEYSQQG